MKLAKWLLVSISLIVIWEVLGNIIPEGLVLGVVNISMFIAACAVGAWGYLPVLKEKYSNPVAWALSFVLWLVVFMLLRSFIFPV